MHRRAAAPAEVGLQDARAADGRMRRGGATTIAGTVSFESAWPRREIRTIAGVRVPYLSRDDLIASKQTGRASDAADIEHLAPARPGRRPRARARR